MAVSYIVQPGAVIEFFVENSSAADVCGRLRRVYGDAYMGASGVRRWGKYFIDGHTDIADQPRKRSTEKRRK
jgi:hypothetical protein